MFLTGKWFNHKNYIVSILKKKASLSVQPKKMQRNMMNEKLKNSQRLWVISLFTLKCSERTVFQNLRIN